MQVAHMNWMQLEDYLTHDDRVVLPLGSVEQHGYLKLGTDAILAERVAVAAAESLGVPVFPVVAYGITPSFAAYPGSLSIRVDTYVHLIKDLLDSLATSGFRRILLVNGHGGNTPAQPAAAEWMADHPRCRVKLHNWWNAPATWAKVMEIDPQASHGSWMENFPWTRVAGTRIPMEQKPMCEADRMRTLNPQEVRTYLGDGNFGGLYQRSDMDMNAVWETAISETRAALEGPWGL